MVEENISCIHYEVQRIPRCSPSSVKDKSKEVTFTCEAWREMKTMSIKKNMTKGTVFSLHVWFCWVFQRHSKKSYMDIKTRLLCCGATLGKSWCPCSSGYKWRGSAWRQLQCTWLRPPHHSWGKATMLIQGKFWHLFHRIIKQLTSESCRWRRLCTSHLLIELSK